jgi:hypothetical protein
MSRLSKCRAPLAAILLALVSITYSTRAFLPYPCNYLTRLAFLNGWSSQGYYAFNCSGLLTNAHGEPFMTERQMYAGEGNLDIVADFPSRADIVEERLHPGDMAAFEGSDPAVEGLHVAAFEGQGVWIDSDNRRGSVAEYALGSKLASDIWFQGRVHILRWKTAAQPRFSLSFFSTEQSTIDKS